MVHYIKYTIESEEGFKLWSTKFHGSITLPLSMIGFLFNCLVIIIFSQKTMRSNTNLILMGISIFDALLMLAYIPYTIYFFLLGTPDPTPDQSAFWPYFALIYSHFSLFTHGCSVWFTCFLAFYRYITVTACVQRGSYTQQANTMLNKNGIHYFMLALVTMVFACMSFNVLSYDIQKGCFQFLRVLKPNETFDPSTELQYEMCSIYPIEDILNSSSTTPSPPSNVTNFNLLWMQDSELSLKYPVIMTINFWIHAVILRTLPCIVLLILSIMLIYVMNIANRNRLKLMQQGRKSEYEKAGEFNRTTTMLLIVCISFLIMEFPHGILYIICGISQTFFRDVYVSLGDLLDLLVLINSSINFFLYCCMSSQFRMRFKAVFLCMSINEHSSGLGSSCKNGQYPQRSFTLLQAPVISKQRKRFQSLPMASLSSTSSSTRFNQSSNNKKQRKSQFFLSLRKKSTTSNIDIHMPAMLTEDYCKMPIYDATTTTTALISNTEP